MDSIIPKGRGAALQKNSSAQPLRRPGESGLKQRFGTSSTIDIPENEKEDKISILCNQICKMHLRNPREELAKISEDVSSVCDSSENLKTFVNELATFALKSKENAHAMALFCKNYGDVSSDEIKLRTLLLRKLQQLYLEKEKNYLTTDKFCMEVRFLCEIFHHITIEGNCIKVLAHPIIEVLCMLVDGGSQKEIEVFYEQFPKCYKNLKANDAKGLDNLVSKIRKQILSQESSFVTRTMLLEVFEFILSDGQKLDEEGKKFYSSMLSVVRICE